MRIPGDIAVIGTGGGGLTIAAELGLAGRPAVLADQPRFSAALEAVDSAGGIEVTFRSSPSDTAAESQLAPVGATSTDPVTAVTRASVVIPAFSSFSGSAASSR